MLYCGYSSKKYIQEKMKEGRISHLSKKDRGQAMVEFVISLPILLFIIFGIIEFARMTFAWMAVQNAARFGVRYAVTGEFNDVYCVEAGNYLGATHINADVHGGDPQDCSIPDTFNPIPPITTNDLERDLIDLARLYSIQDAATGGGTGLWLRPNVSGNYEQFLANHNEAFIGLPAEEGFYHITICSNRNGQFGMSSNFAIPLCVDLSNLDPITLLPPMLMDDAGGPGDRVKVHVEHEHPFFLPLLSNIWPSVTLSAERDGIVEKFRTSRVIGVSGPILSAPTWTQTPTITPTPTITSTPTSTFTPTITSTSTLTPTPDCSLYFMTDFNFRNNAIQEKWIVNGDVVDAVVSQIQFDWNYAEQYGIANGFPNLYVDWFTWNGSYFHLGWNGDGVEDDSSPTTWSGALPFNSGGVYNWDIDFDGDWGGGSTLPDVVSSDFGVIIDFTNGCQLVQNVVPRVVISWTPTITPSITYTPTITLTPTMTPSPTITPTPTTTPTPSDTPVPTLTFTPSNTPTPTETFTQTATFTPSWTPSITPTASDTPTPTDTRTPSITPIPPTITNTLVASATFTPTASNTPTETPIPTWTPACPFDDPNWPCQSTWTPTP